MTRNLYCLRDKISHDVANFFSADYDSQAVKIIYDWFDAKSQESRFFDPSVYELLCVANVIIDCSFDDNPLSLVDVDDENMKVPLNYPKRGV
ncbi:hypothetical protein [Sigmofec virus UA08Rod_4343]|uniref:Uncharacterized protein n=1 Tax=Sigmofec virus UA08Rod_4343 TaxID=2929400 RepID=A0A976N1S0_9VIRU|nr:hypothetical protein [Sigmofec virus UA08Rod_4343]